MSINMCKWTGTFVVATGMLAGAVTADAAVVGRAVSGAGDLNLTSYTNAFDPAAGGTAMSNFFDTFMIHQLVVADDSGQDVSFDLVDDSIDDFPTDTLGIVVDGVDGDPFFGIEDVLNTDNSTNAVATFAFDISSATAPALSVSLDIAAMGDFEPADVTTISYSIDGGSTFVPIFTLNVDDDGSHDYFMASGTLVTLADPLVVNGLTELDNTFQTFVSGPIVPTGSTLLIQIDSVQDAGSEVIALRNLVISDVPEPASLALLGLGGLAMLRRRSA